MGQELCKGRAILGLVFLCLIIFINTEIIAIQSVSKDDSKVLIIEDIPPFGISNAIEEALNELNISYDVVSSTNFASVDISKYKVIIIPSDQPTSYYNNMVNYVNKLKDFVIRGNVIIAHMTDMGLNGGTWSQSFLPCALNLSHINLQINDLTIVNYNHPVINGPYGSVTDESLDNWYFSAHGYFTNIPKDSNIVVGYTYDPIAMPVYIEWKCGYGLILATMMPLEWAWEWKYEGGVIMLKNELIYAHSYNPLLIGGSVIKLPKNNMVKYYGLNLITLLTITILTILYNYNRRTSS